MTVTPTDVAENLGRPAPDQNSPLYKQWDRWITAVLLVIKNRLGPTEQLDQDTLDYVVLETVSERAAVALRQGQTSTTVTVDDGTVTNRWENSTDTRGFDFDDRWWGWALLLPRTSQEGFSTRPTFAPDRRC
ncbi:hypothetical protein INN71_02725 [Nocardioides sp. ChNu-153]|uniref:hypothetical protein n=1 Tax=Nocardioides sp. ChNu-153 TaxID=2779364 RepID=UPI002653105C|nr:hypothetical protein [Nocardioides sp. ChNu-153]MDN7120300.1 hypothetical protein [Nocardioides sp. ChNu-153]